MGQILVQVNDNRDYGGFLTPHAADVTRSWVKNEIGTAEMTFPITTPFLWAICDWGRIIRIHEYGLPAWVGSVVEREWSEGGVTLHLKSAEWHLAKKVTRQGLILGQSAAGPVTAGQIGFE